MREAVIALRRAGKSRREIRAELGVSNRRLTEWLQGVPPAKEIYRHNAKDALRMRARELRIAGKTYDEIIEVMPVSKSRVLFIGSQRCGDLSNSIGEAGAVVFGDLPANGERTKTATSGLLRIELQCLDDLVARPGGGKRTWRPARPGEPCTVQGLPRLPTGAKLSADRRT